MNFTNPFKNGGIAITPGQPRFGGRQQNRLHRPKLPNFMVSGQGAECVFTFGSGDHGLHGNGGTKFTWKNNLTPSMVKKLAAKDFIGLACGPNHTFAVTKEEGMYGWGSGAYGNCIPASAAPSHALPFKITDGDVLKQNRIVHAASTIFQTCALADSGDVYVWGDKSVYWSKLNMETLLMDNDTGDGDKFKIERIPSLCQKRVVQLAAGYSHFLCLNAGGTVYSWGENTYGKLGHGHERKLQEPTRVKELKWMQVAVTYIAAGDNHSVAVGTMNGERVSLSWGKWDERLGHGDTYPTGVVEPVLPRKPRRHAFGRLTYQQLFVEAKARNLERKQHKEVLLGHIMEYEWEKYRIEVEKRVREAKRLSEPRLKHPKLIPALRRSKVFQAYCGECHTIALDTKGDVYAWGKNQHCQLGLGDTNPRSKPVKIRGLKNIAFVAVGARHCMAVTKRGELLAWGDNQYGQCGHGDAIQRSVPRVISSLWGYAVNFVACGTRHSAVITTRPRSSLNGKMVNHKFMPWRHSDGKENGIFHCGQKASPLLAPPTFNYKVKAMEGKGEKTQENRTDNRPPEWLKLTYEADADNKFTERVMTDRKLWTLGYHNFIENESHVRSRANKVCETFQQVDERNFRLRDAYFRRKKAVRAVKVIGRAWKRYRISKRKWGMRRLQRIQNRIR